MLEIGPKGMQIDPMTGQLLWSFTQSDSWAQIVRVVAKDSEGLSASQEYSLGLTLPQ